jgi:hypothetical protein
VEIAFKEDFAVARDAAMLAKGEAGPAGDAEEIGAEKIIQLAKIDPAVAIIEIWRQLETEIYSLIAHNGMMRFTTPTRFVQHLAKLGKISEVDYDLFKRLQNIRNSAVHSGPAKVTLAEVVEFKEFIGVLTKKFDQIKSEPGDINVPDLDDPKSR